jgi:hypothetical protein
VQGTPALDAARGTNVVHWNRHATLRRAAAELLRVLDHVSGPGDPDMQPALGDSPPLSTDGVTASRNDGRTGRAARQGAKIFSRSFAEAPAAAPACTY